MRKLEQDKKEDDEFKHHKKKTLMSVKSMEILEEKEYRKKFEEIDEVNVFEDMCNLWPNFKD